MFIPGAILDNFVLIVSVIKAFAVETFLTLTRGQFSKPVHAAVDHTAHTVMVFSSPLVT